VQKRQRVKLPTAYKVVKAEWTDAWSEDGWKDIKKLPENSKDAKVSTIGWLVNEDEEFYYIANSVSAQQVACTMVIPKSMTHSIVEIVVQVSVEDTSPKGRGKGS
jgi:hypothetical protein